MASFIGAPKFQSFTNSGELNVGGFVHTYVAGTVNTPLTTYPSIEAAGAGTPANANPVPLDTRGEAVIVIKAAVKLVITDADGNILSEVDNFETDLTATPGTGVQNVVDPNGNIILKYSYVNNAENYVEIKNSVTATNPSISALGATATGVVLANTGGTNFTVQASGSTSTGIIFSNSAGTSPRLSASGTNSKGLLVITPTSIRAIASGGQTIPNGTPTKVQFATEIFDKGSWYSASAATPLIPGIYAVSAYIVCVSMSAPVTNATNILYIYKNGVAYSNNVTILNASSGTLDIKINDLVSLNGTTDTIEIYLAQLSSASSITPTTDSYFCMHLVEAT